MIAVGMTVAMGVGRASEVGTELIDMGLIDATMATEEVMISVVRLTG